MHKNINILRIIILFPLPRTVQRALDSISVATASARTVTLWAGSTSPTLPSIRSPRWSLCRQAYTFCSPCIRSSPFKRSKLSLSISSRPKKHANPLKITIAVTVMERLRRSQCWDCKAHGDDDHNGGGGGDDVDDDDVGIDLRGMMLMRTQ